MRRFARSSTRAGRPVVFHLIGSHIVGGAERLQVGLTKELVRRGIACQVGVLNPGGPLEVEIRDIPGVEIVAFGPIRGWDLRPILRIRRHIRKLQPRAVLAWGPRVNFFLMAGAFGFPCRKFISIMSGEAAFVGWDYVWAYVFDRWFSQYVATAILANSRVGKRFFARMGFLERKIELVPNGVDFSRLDDESAGPGPGFREEIGIARDAPLLVTLSSFNPPKDYPTLLEALRRLRERVPAVRLVSIGDGPLRREMEERAHRLGLTGVFLSLGSGRLGSGRDVGRVLRASDVYVQSSRTEGLSTAILEALYVGLPIAATMAGDNTLLLSSRPDCALAPCGDPEGLVRAIVHCLGRLPRERSRRPEIAREYGIEAYADRHLARYGLGGPP